MTPPPTIPPAAQADRPRPILVLSKVAGFLLLPPLGIRILPPAVDRRGRHRRGGATELAAGCGRSVAGRWMPWGIASGWNDGACDSCARRVLFSIGSSVEFHCSTVVMSCVLSEKDTGGAVFQSAVSEFPCG
jgi:hypothetical protein